MRKRVQFAGNSTSSPDNPKGHIRVLPTYDEPTAGLINRFHCWIDLIRQLQCCVAQCDRDSPSTIHRTADRIVFHAKVSAVGGTVSETDTTDNPLIRQFLLAVWKGPIQVVH